jgi:hypothetical protein
MIFQYLFDSQVSADGGVHGDTVAEKPVFFFALAQRRKIIWLA